MVATNSMATRSTLELMLDKIQQLEEDQPKDILPALPVRPVSRARLPRACKPLKLEFRRRSCEENDASFKWGGFESNRTKKEDYTESDHFQTGTELSENSKKIGVSKIQRCYRGHQVRCSYKELREGTIALQSFIRGENARRGYQYRSSSPVTKISDSILNPRLKDLINEPRSRKKKPRESSNLELVTDTKDQTQVPYGVVVDLQKRVLRTEAKVRHKELENIALKTQLHEMEKKWQQYEKRMASLEKAWQDQFTHIQESLAAAKKNRAPQIRDATRGPYNQNPYTNHVVDRRESIHDRDGNLTEDGDELVCIRLQPHAELRKLKIRFKAWKKEYRYKLRDAESALKKLGNSETAKSQKNWWGRLSY